MCLTVSMLALLIRALPCLHSFLASLQSPQSDWPDIYYALVHYNELANFSIKKENVFNWLRQTGGCRDKVLTSGRSDIQVLESDD